MSIRDNLRSKATNGKFRTKIVEVEGERVLVKQPSVRGRRDLMNKATKENGQVDLAEFLIWGLINNCYVPEDAKGADGKKDPDAGKRIWEDTDYDSLMEQPAGGTLDELGSVAAELLNVEEGNGKSN